VHSAILALIGGDVARQPGTCISSRMHDDDDDYDYNNDNDNGNDDNLNDDDDSDV